LLKASAIACSKGGRSTPRSVMKALISVAGVMSKAGFQARASSGATGAPALAPAVGKPRTSAAARSSMAIAAPLAMRWSKLDSGAAT